VNRSGCDRAPKPGLHLAKYCPPIGVVTEPDNREQNGLFEGAKSISHQLDAYIVDICQMRV
jgi:hypothetical protein